MSKVWFITGAGSGIGAATARAALGAGDRVIATGRNLDKVRTAYRDVAGDDLLLERLDVTDEAEAKRAFDAAVARFGRIDVLVNNAGYSLLGNFEELTTEQIERQFAPNFWGVVHVMRAVLPIMRRQRSGHLINISSVAGVVGQRAVAAYGASKFAVEGLSLAVAQEVEPFGINVTVVEPGFFRTGLLSPTLDSRQSSSSYVPEDSSSPSTPHARRGARLAMDTATILHADLDAFYASVEQMLDPSLRGKPIAVGGGVVLAASYEAKSFGVHSGMPGRRARALCPDLVFVGGHFKEYQRLGDAAIRVLDDFTPLVERISIDEAFADVTGCTHLFGTPAEIAVAIRRRVRDELALPISIGVARTKHLAKIASQVAKPDGLVVVDPETELAFLHDLPVEMMWGVGPATRARLAERGIATIGDLAMSSTGAIARLLGRAAGERLAALAWNRDPRAIRTHVRAHSVGAQSALGRRAVEDPVIRRSLRHLADRVGSRLRAKGKCGRTVTVRVRFGDLRSVTHAVTLPQPVAATAILAEIAEDLVRAVLRSHPEERAISLVAISVSHIEEQPVVQLDLPLGLADEARRPGASGGIARLLADRAVDAIRDRFGWESVGYASVALDPRRSVPDAFRELAEREL